MATTTNEEPVYLKREDMDLIKDLLSQYYYSEMASSEDCKKILALPLAVRPDDLEVPSDPRYF